MHNRPEKATKFAPYRCFYRRTRYYRGVHAEGTMESFDYILFIVTGALLLYELAEFGRGRSNLFSKMREWFFPKKK